MRITGNSIKLALMVLTGMTAGMASAAPLVSWDFPDQGPNANADYSATALTPSATGGAMTLGSGTFTWNAVTCDGGYTYIDDSCTNIANANYYVGDASESGISGYTASGNLSLITEGVFGFEVAPVNVTNAATALSNGIYFDFPVTAVGTTLTVTNFNFLAASGNHTSRLMTGWELQVSIDGGAFSTLHTGTSWSSGTKKWAKESSAALSQDILDGQTATFRLFPQSTLTAGNSRYSNFDAVTIEGTGAAGVVQYPPVLTPEPYTGADAITNVYYTLDISGAVTDQNGDAITNYAKFTGDSWINVETNGLIYGTPDVGGVTSTVEVVITDATGLSSTNTVYIPVIASSLAWGVSDIGKGVVAVGEVFADTVADRIDTSAGNITFTNLTGGWLVVDENTGELSGTPTAGDYGVNTFTIRADDGVLQKDATVTIDVIFGEQIWGENFENTVILSGGNWKTNAADRSEFYYSNDVRQVEMDAIGQADVWFTRAAESNTVRSIDVAGVSEVLNWQRGANGVIIPEADLLASGAGSYMVSADFVGTDGSAISYDVVVSTAKRQPGTTTNEDYVVNVEDGTVSGGVAGSATNLASVSFGSTGNLQVMFEYSGTNDLILAFDNVGDTGDYAIDSIRLHKVENQTPAAATNIWANNSYERIGLFWETGEELEGDVASYNIYRSTISSSDATNHPPVDSATGTDYCDENVVVGTTYYYAVTVVDAGGLESAATTDEVSATASAIPADVVFMEDFNCNPNFHKDNYVNVPSEANNGQWFCSWNQAVQFDAINGYAIQTRVDKDNVLGISLDKSLFTAGHSYGIAWTNDATVAVSGGLRVRIYEVNDAASYSIDTWVPVLAETVIGSNVVQLLQYVVQGDYAMMESATNFTYSSSENDIVVTFMADYANTATYNIDNLMIVDLGPAGSTFDSWASNHGVSNDPNAVNNPAGINNITCYGLGLDPLTGDVDNGALPTFGPGAGGLEYIHVERADDDSLVYSLATTANLVVGPWTTNAPGTFVVGTDETGGTFNTVTNVIPTVDNQKFIKLIVE